MFFILRLIPLFCSVAVGLAFFIQYGSAASYPWLAGFGIFCVFVGAFLIARGSGSGKLFSRQSRMSGREWLEQLVPLLLFLGTLGFAMLLAEGEVHRWLISGMGMAASFIVLELVYVRLFMPSRYPIHGLSRVNLALVPLVVWYAIFTSVGLMVFMQTPQWAHVLGVTGLGLLLFRMTEHSEATAEKRRRWMLIGGGVGLQIGVFTALIPIALEAQGALGVILFGGMLRTRRYGYLPKLKRNRIIGEVSMAVILILLVTFTTRWL